MNVEPIGAELSPMFGAQERWAVPRLQDRISARAGQQEDGADRTIASVEPSDTNQRLAKLRAAAGAAVGNVFFGTLLRAVRESTPTDSYGFGGRGEEAFRGQLDSLLAERLGVSPAGGALTDSVYQEYARQAVATGPERDGLGGKEERPST